MWITQSKSVYNGDGRLYPEVIFFANTKSMYTNRTVKKLSTSIQITKIQQLEAASYIDMFMESQGEVKYKMTQ